MSNIGRNTKLTPEIAMEIKQNKALKVVIQNG